MLAVFGAAVLAPATAGAQHGRPRPSIEPAIDYALATPAACLDVSEFLDLARRQGAEDTAVYTPAKGLSAAARSDVARCLQAVDRPSTRPQQWLALARAALIVEDDAAAERWHKRYLEHMGDAPPARRAWAQYLVMRAYAEAPRPRLAAAQTAIRALEGMGAPAARARLLAQVTLMETAARLWLDTLRMQAANECMRIYRDLTPALRNVLWVETAECVTGRAEALLRLEGGTTARAALDSGIALLKGTGAEPDLQYLWRPLYGLVDQPAAPIEATRWFRRQGAEGKPARGVVTVLRWVSHAFGRESGYQAGRRLAARFADRPFELIHHAKTLGFFGDSGAPMPPEREIALDSAYFYGYAKMAGMLAVAATPFTIGVDGRRLEQPTPQEQNYLRAELVVIDKHGRVRYVDSRGVALGGPQEELLARFIEKLLAEP